MRLTLYIFVLLPALCFAHEPVSIPTYDRADWKLWDDFDKGCQKTRDEMLIRDSTVPVAFKKPAKKCKVKRGSWTVPYTGNTYTDPLDVDIDHIVPLKHAYEHGGAFWSTTLKRLFANDPENLLVAEDNANQSKGDKGPVEWKPPLESYWCVYIKRKYRLSMSKAEKDELKIMRRRC